MMNLKMTEIRRERISIKSPERYRYTNLLGVTAGRSSSGTESGTATAMDTTGAVYCDAAITHRSAIDTEFPCFFFIYVSFPEFHYSHPLPSSLQGELYHRLDDRRNEDRCPVEDSKKYSFLHSVQTGSGAFTASYPVCTGIFPRGNKTARESN
jgi:hypothetical protein